jgi:hypothetical protein
VVLEVQEVGILLQAQVFPSQQEEVLSQEQEVDMALVVVVVGQQVEEMVFPSMDTMVLELEREEDLFPHKQGS